MATLNPRTKTFEFGLRELKSCVIYPLSMADQFRLTNAISKAAEQYQEATLPGNITLEEVENEDTPDTVSNAAKTVVNFLQENVETILVMVTDEKDRPTMDEMDNVQLAELVEIIFDNNYANTIKNFQSLIEKARGLFPSMRQ